VPRLYQQLQSLVMRKKNHKTAHKIYLNTIGVSHCHTAMGSKSFSSLLIGCIRRPTPRRVKGSSSITDNMIIFNDISVYNILNLWPCWLDVWVAGHKYEKGSSKD
jgi:hypothetical protein